MKRIISIILTIMMIVSTGAFSVYAEVAPAANDEPATEYEPTPEPDEKHRPPCR